MIKMDIIRVWGGLNQVGKRMQQSKWLLRSLVVSLCLGSLLVSHVACTSTRRRVSFTLYPEEQVSANNLELDRQTIARRLEWLQFKSAHVRLKDDTIVVTFEAPRVYTDDVLAQIFQTGLVEWLDIGARSYNRGDRIEQQNGQCTILTWQSLDGKVGLVSEPDQKRYSLGFFADSLEVERSLTIENRFCSTEPGIRNLCLVRDGVVFFCYQIVLPVPQCCSLDNMLDCFPPLDGKATIPIPPDYDLSPPNYTLIQVDVLASQMQSGPLSLSYKVTQNK